MSLYNSTPISNLVPGAIVLPTDIYPATDTTDPTQSPVGSTKKYSINQLANFMLTNVVGSALVTVYCSSTFNLNATYNNGTNGIGATLTNAGFLTGLMLDGIFPVGGERVLITNQTNQTQNGIYIVTNAGSLTQAWVLTRATDFDNSASSRIVQGNYLPVLFGNLNALTFWFLISPTPITLGSDNVIFTIQNNASNESWVVQSSGTVTMSVNTGYTIANPSGIVYLTLPPISIP